MGTRLSTQAGVRASPGVCRRITVRATAAGRQGERRAEQGEAGRLKAQGLSSHVQALWTKTGNHVQSNKYTVLTFLPLALRLQFREVANVYFLFIAVFYAWERV
eukprot:COSAG02_NODE_25085_length_669_cov_1.177193_2_plen_103_part_01